MKEYLLHFVQILEGIETDLYWRCQADDYDHAVEQLLNAEPEGVLFYELLKVSA